MCGIAALFAYGRSAPPVDAAELTAMSDHMVRRGPDGAGLWRAADGGVGLAHRRLAIIDLSETGAQPMAIEGGRFRITFNGEIYNYRALRAELESRGVAFDSESDTEVILRLYAAEGPAMVGRLRGMFAFALWDENRRGLLLARDPLGIKPLYYADDGATLRAASQVKALIAGGRAGRGIDAAGHAGFFVFGHVPDPHTLYADIRALPAGHTLWADASGPRTPACYFDVGTVLAAAGEEPSTTSLREVLIDSVRHHLVADVPVGMFLSSGLDSATLTGLASEVEGAGLHTLTLAFDEFAGTSRDEAPLAESVAAAYATHHATRRVAGADFRAARADLLAAMDQPTIDGVNTYFVAKAAAESGLKVAMSGLGGDELFGGYDTFRQVPRLVGALGWIPGGRAAGRLLRGMTAPVVRHLTSPKAAGLLEYGTDYADAYVLRRGLFAPWELPRVMDPGLVRTGWPALHEEMRQAVAGWPTGDPHRRVAALEMTFYMRNQLLRDADWAGMAHSLEIRVPLVDAFLLRALAPAISGPRRLTKAAMARTPATPLPAAVLHRPKTGFFIPVRDWLADDGQGTGRGLRGWARAVYAAATGVS